ncbi:MAG: metallophosphoesterase [Luteolibacter sp.]
MYFIKVIVAGIPLLSLVWWFWADRRLRGSGVGWVGRTFFGLTIGGILAGYLWMVLTRRDMVSNSMPAGLCAVVLLWGVLFMPMLAIPSMAGWSAWSLLRRISGRKKAEISTDARWTRRKWLGTLATAMPMLATFGTAAISLPRLSRFRIRKITLALDELPAALDGIRIAHVSDPHVGKFAPAKMLDEIVVAINGLDADLVLFTGDLIDNTLHDLPLALGMVKRFRGKSGVFLIEGNHDLLESPEAFEKGVRESGIAMLRNEAATLQIRGVPVQVLGVVWSSKKVDMEDDVKVVAALRDSTAFHILMTHHPHVFDYAVQHGFPLTLAGHTHGGQVMLTPEFGAGSLWFRYWTGVYRKAGRTLLVNNGVGNWFPLRLNAPAEIIELTLRKASAGASPK